jgi:D-serine deaminase-like pyridoxal phosphate-dependent protein
LQGKGTRHLQVGDRVWFRHAKAGELCERFDALHLVSGTELVETVPTYRGEGRNFG